MNMWRIAGLGLVISTIGRMAGFLGVAAPGGEYEPGSVAGYVSSGHQWTAFAFGYVGLLASLGMLAFGHAARSLWPRVGETIWALSVAATTVSVVGGFVISGVVVSYAEGGLPVRDGVPHPVVYVLGETGNLLALCAPAFFLGIAAIILARAAAMPTWLRVWAVAAGVCGILLPFYFTIPVYTLWVLVFGVWLAVRGERAGAQATARLHESLV